MLFLLELSYQLGQIMARYDFLETGRVTGADPGGGGPGPPFQKI